jgi:hypothetical protein
MWLAYRDPVHLPFAVHLLSPTARERGSEPTIMPHSVVPSVDATCVYPEVLQAITFGIFSTRPGLLIARLVLASAIDQFLEATSFEASLLNNLSTKLMALRQQLLPSATAAS